MGVHGAGFDDCELMPTSSERQTMQWIALVAVVVPSFLAFRMLRRWARIAALGATVVCGAALFFLVRGGQDCGLT